MNISSTLAKNVAGTGYDQLPEDAVDATKKDIMDILGTTVAGSNEPGIVEIAELVKDWAGKQESTLIAHDQKVPAPAAAMVNGAMGHALDYDDGHDGAITHAATTVVPAAFAIAQRVKNVNGKDFITAVALGIDLVCRMGLACKKPLKETGWVYTSIFGYFGSAAAAGKLLGLSGDGMSNALGIALSQTSGSYQSIADAVLTKRLQPGFAARGGVMSALLAEKGVSGIRNFIEGDWGIYNTYIRGAYDPDALVAGLGTMFEVSNMGFKAYPCCGYTHAPIFATLKLVHDHDIRPDEVADINVSVGENAYQLCTPIERKRRPETIPDSQFSIPYTVAAAVVKRKVGIGEFTAEAIRDPRVIRMAAKVKPRISAELTRRQIEPAVVEIRTVSGQVYSERVDDRKGSPKNPMTRNELVDKFKDCVSHGRKPFSAKTAEQVVEYVDNLEGVDDVSRIVEMLA